MPRPKRDGPIAASVVTLAELFSGAYRFRLPWFQRSYAWRVENVSLLLGNIREAMRSDERKRHYFLGTILLAEPDGSATAALVDGHQRVMTLTILFAVLRDLMKDAAWRERLDALITVSRGPDGSLGPTHLTIDPEIGLAAYVSQHVQKLGGTTNEPDEDLLSLTETERNVIENRDYLRSELGAGNVGDKQRQELAEFLLSRCRVIVHEVEDEQEAWRWLQIEEETRLDFSAADRSKATLVGAMPPAQREEAGRIWDDCQALVGAHDMRALLHHVRTLALRKRSEAPVESQLSKYFKINVDGLQFLRRELQPRAELLRRIRKQDLGTTDQRPRIARSLEHMSWIDRQIWLPTALHWLDKRREDHPSTSAFLGRLERLVWLMRLAGSDPSVQENRMIKIVTQIDATDDPEAMDALAVERHLIDAARVNLRSPTFHAKRYSADVLRRISVALGADPGPVDGKRVTVEHILPRNPPPDTLWWRDFTTKKKVQNYAHRLGNLLFLTEEQNQKASAYDYGFKRGVFVEALQAGPNPLVEHALQYPVWTVETIDERTRDLIDILFKGWDLKQ